MRCIGVELGLPAAMVYRRPFPRPRLGVRILGEFMQAAAETLRLADHIFIEELRKAGWYEKDQPGVRGVPASEISGCDG